MGLLLTAARETALVSEPRSIVVVVDHHQLCRESLAAAIAESGRELRVCAAPPDPSIIGAALSPTDSGVVVLSCCSRSMHPWPLLLAIRIRNPGVRLIVLADAKSFSFPDYDRRLSVDAVLQPTSDIAAVVQAIATAGPAIPHGTTMIERPRLLTPREAQIVRHVAAGLRNAQIASQIGIAEKTVKVNLTNIYGKLGIHDRAELTALAPQLLSMNGSSDPARA